MIIKQSNNTGSGGSLKLLRLFFPLAILFVLCVMAYSSLEAQTMTCDILDPDYEGPGVRKLCRPVPDYFLDNFRAKMKLADEIDRRLERERAGGARFTMPNPLVDGSRGNYGYRCPDAQGECPSVWVPSPGGSSGLSNAGSFAGATDVYIENVYIQRISGAGIGNQAILDENPIDAIDIWGTDDDAVDINRKVCFLGQGRIRFVDTDSDPRSNWLLTTTVEGEGDNTRTCTTVPGRGQVIFLPPSG